MLYKKFQDSPETITVKELRDVARYKNIKAPSHKTRAQLCEQMGILTNQKRCTSSISIPEKFKNSPKTICLIDCETNEKHHFKSLYACCKHFEINPGKFAAKERVKNKSYGNWVNINDKKYTIQYGTVSDGETLPASE